MITKGKRYKEIFDRVWANICVSLDCMVVQATIAQAINFDLLKN